MINEYLFLSGEYRAAVEEYQINAVIIEITSIENAQLWAASFSFDGRNEDGAQKPSDVHIALSKYSP